MLDLLAQLLPQTPPPPNVINAVIQTPPESIWPLVVNASVGILSALVGAGVAIFVQWLQHRNRVKHDADLRRKGLLADFGIASHRYMRSCNMIVVLTSHRDRIIDGINKGDDRPHAQDRLNKTRDRIDRELEKRIDNTHELDVARLRLIAHSDQQTYDEANVLYQKVINTKTSPGEGKPVDRRELQRSTDDLAFEIDQWVAGKCFGAEATPPRSNSQTLPA